MLIEVNTRRKYFSISASCSEMGEADVEPVIVTTGIVTGARLARGLKDE